MAGLEVLFASVQNQLKGAEDAIICCLHWAIISQDIKCIGAGEQVRMLRCLNMGKNNALHYNYLFTQRLI